MNTDFKTGEQTISNNVEYEKYSVLELDLNKLIETLEYELYTPVPAELLTELKSFEQTIFDMRHSYDKERLKQYNRKTKRTKH